MTAMKHKRSLIVKKLLEEERDLRINDDTSLSSVMSASMMTLEEVSEVEVMSTTNDSEEKTTYTNELIRSDRMGEDLLKNEYCVLSCQRKNDEYNEKSKDIIGGKMNLIRQQGKMKFSDVIQKASVRTQLMSNQPESERHPTILHGTQTRECGDGIQEKIKKCYDVCAKLHSNKII